MARALELDDLKAFSNPNQPMNLKMLVTTSLSMKPQKKKKIHGLFLRNLPHILKKN